MKIKPIKALRVLFGQDEKSKQLPPDFEPIHTTIIEKVRPYTMTSPERLYGLIESVQYVVKNNIGGALVECGVWKGGSMMAIAETLLALGVTDRELYLYDTFEGMTAPTEEDVDQLNRDAASQLQQDASKKSESVVWAYSGLAEVKQNIARTGYPANKIHFIQGDILKTIPSHLPGTTALLRLDTDWYESTKHEMEHLYPLLVSKGILIIDDYGFWKGSKKAVDEYLQQHQIQLMLHRMDETGRSAVKP
ncbi:TylF/MycF/NovP-related O-methyltransferase [Sediminibacterium salmoneum]|uniref:TylF/MycF/NovP-related O-methyltransferase n=1 Tax=Sediminibacterium salmoneum TaxID=426421 RepID=UPI00047A4177|nr:TylF/MycF/NovP-related O-methyltransferase [Sediminibacterium salmoneum]